MPHNLAKIHSAFCKINGLFVSAEYDELGLNKDFPAPGLKIMMIREATGEMLVAEMFFEGHGNSAIAVAMKVMVSAPRTYHEIRVGHTTKTSWLLSQ